MVQAGSETGRRPASPPRAATPLQEYLGECRTLVTDEITRLFADREHDLYDLILDYPLREGKALRPTLAIASCRALGGTAESVLKSAATLELYHNAFLIHDDVEDDSLMRRGKPTLHAEHGIPIAVNVGDAMLGLSLQPLLDNVGVVGLGPALKVLRSVAHMTHESVEGQASELDWVRHNRWDVTDDDYIEMVVQKTGWYSFIAPMQVGAISAGANPDVVAAFEGFGRDLSVSFQIVDDVLNLRADPDLYGKEIGGDLWEGKRTLILLHTMRHAGPADRARAIEILGKARPMGDDIGVADLLESLVDGGDLTEDGRTRLLSELGGGPGAEKTHAEVQWLFDLVRSQGSIDYAAGIARDFAERARAQLEAMRFLRPSRHRQVLSDVVDYVHERAK